MVPENVIGTKFPPSGLDFGKSGRKVSLIVFSQGHCMRAVGPASDREADVKVKSEDLVLLL